VRVQQQDGGGVDAEECPNPVQEFVEQIGDVELGQGGVGDRLEAAQPLVALDPLRVNHDSSLAAPATATVSLSNRARNPPRICSWRHSPGRSWTRSATGSPRCPSGRG
jgi:hypothetical protein